MKVCMVVQSWINGNPGLKLNLLIKFVYFYKSVEMKTSALKKGIAAGTISQVEMFANFEN